jgi:hypothetical protein
MSEPFAFDAYVIDMQEAQEKAQAWGEYRTHGGKLDFTAWEEMQEREGA